MYEGVSLPAVRSMDWWQTTMGVRARRALRGGRATVLLLVLVAAGCRAEAPAASDAAEPVAYVGRDVCAACHADAAARYAGSDHDRAIEAPTPASVLGDFSGVTFRHDGVASRFLQRGDSFFVRTPGPDGVARDYAVRYTFGYRPLQQYLVETERGRLQALTTAWDTERGRWFTLYPGDTLRAGEALHWTGAAMNWNYMCADCHSTALRKGYDPATDTYHTTWAELDVSCEACHGPGAEHVAWARDGTAGPDADADPAYGLARLDAQGPQLDACAPCHSRRRPLTGAFDAGAAFLDHFEPQVLEAGLYFADGQIDDEVYVYGSFLQSKMHAAGVTCTDCHDPHTTRVREPGNALCTACHAAADYDTADHLRHAAGTDGARCVDCHMPARTYMVVDPRRDHSLRVPRPDLTADLGTPNACNGCHADETAAWAAAWVERWYGPRAADEAPHFAYALDRARRGAPGADVDLARLIGDVRRAGIVRATALDALAGYQTAEARQATRSALIDPDPLVRAAALRAAERLAPDAVEAHAPALLADTLRLIRTEAARVLALAGRARPGSRLADDPRLAEALAEYRATQATVADQPAAHLNLGALAEALGAPDDAEAAYRTALRLDSTFAAAHVNLAVLYNARRAAADPARARRLRADAERHLRRAVRHAPELAQAHYALGLLLGETAATMPEAAAHLAEAARLTPDDPRAAYNAGLAYQHLGQTDEAERHLLAAHRLAPEQPDYLDVLSILYAQQGRWAEALRYAERLQQQVPGAPAVQQRVRMLRARAGEAPE